MEDNDFTPPMIILSIPLPKATPIKFGDLRLPLEEVSLKKLQEMTTQRNNVLMSIENCGAELAINHIQNYLPSLFSVIDAFEKLPTEYSKYGNFDFSWSTCIGTTGEDKKRLIKNFYFEVVMMLLVYGLSYRKKAIEILKESNSNSKFDTNSKEISNALCIAAGIFEYIPTYLVQWGEEASTFPFPEQYKSTYDMLSSLCIAEAQMVTVKKAHIKNMSVGNIAKLSKGVRSKIGNCLDNLHEISQTYKIPLEKIKNFVFVHLTYNSFLYNALTEKYLALEKYSASKYGHSISCLSQGALYLDKPKPELDTYDLNKLWESFTTLKNNIQTLLEKYQKENEMIYYETIPGRNDVEDVAPKFLNTTSPISFVPPDHPEIQIIVKETMCHIL